ncbi:MAG TPA: Flp pilus assembly protein CpaB [bacterium]|nr:Flp pilus assembly protein CpaB [bacterium]
MRNHKILIALVVGAFSGILAFYLLYQKVTEIQEKTTPVPVLVASRYIAPGSYLKADMVERKSIPEAYVSPSAIRDIKEVEGLASMTAISSGEQVLSNKFGMGEDSLAVVLNPGYRAYTLEVSETSGVGNLLRPGNYVDILTKTESNKSETTSFVFQNLQVLAVGDKLVKLGKSSSDAGNTSSTTGTTGYSTVTLAVTPEQAETLMYLEGHPLRLLLRAPSDDEIVSITPQSGSEVLARLGHFTPKPRGKGIEIIRGSSSKGE